MEPYNKRIRKRKKKIVELSKMVHLYTVMDTLCIISCVLFKKKFNI